MKKLKLFGIILASALFITACSCSKTKEYTVTFDSNGGTTVSSQTVKEGKTLVEPKEPTYEGYTFDGWELDGVKFDFNTKITKDITLKASWTKNANANPDEPNNPEEPVKPEEPTKPDDKVTIFTVTFNSDGGSKVATKYVQLNYKAKKPADPTKEGYKFLGWYLNGKLYDFSAKVTKSITLTAKWEEVKKEPVMGYLQVDVEESIVGETYLYVTKDGEKVDGYLDITTTENTRVTKKISKSGYKTNKYKISKIENPRLEN